MMQEQNNVRNWASSLDDNARLQAERTGRLPILAGPVALMPDAHLGIGATVGSVIATKNAIIPAAVGVDLGCGMVASLTTIPAAYLPDSLGPFMDDVRQAVPSGVGTGTEADSPNRAAALSWLAAHPHPTGLDGEQLGTAARQLGSLGSGNHFFEVCLDELNRVWLVLHSGSRGIGNRLADRHIRIARALAPGLHLEDPDLAYFMQDAPEFDAYVQDMLWSQDYARANREIMMAEVTRRFFKWIGRGEVIDTVNCHHNFAQLEEHDGHDVWVTRKGAISARPGEPGIIPGSMGTRSYIVDGKGNPASYHSSPHGAGRRMGRNEARKQLSTDSLRAMMAGRIWQDRDADALLDEHPLAYKDIDQVMADSADLVTIRHELRQILNYKGADEPRRKKRNKEPEGHPA